MEFQTPLEVGQTITLSKLYDDQEGFINDGRGNMSCHVKGQLVHVCDVDRPASSKFGRECLTWRLAMATKIMNSTINDVALLVVKPTNIHSLRARFPGAFKEYEARYGSTNVPERKDNTNIDIPAELIGKYDGPESYEAYIDAVRSKTSIAPMGIEERRAELQRQMEALDSDHPDAAFQRDVSEFAAPESGISLSTWALIPSTGDRKKLMLRGILTVEQLAGANDSVLETLGAGQWNKYREKARQAIGK